jgi:hypothetical protein
MIMIMLGCSLALVLGDPAIRHDRNEKNVEIIFIA